MPLYTKFKFNFCSPKWLYLQNSLLSVCKRFVNESYYDILKIPETCSSKDVREAFITLSKKNHPDKHLNDPSMHERFIRINEAYSVLINPLSRRAYDINLHQKKKLGAPMTERHQQQDHMNIKTSSGAKTSHSSKTNYSNYTRGDPFTFHYQTSRSDTKSEESAYYGVKGWKRVSNNRIASVVILVTFFAVMIQLITIRITVKKNREEALERSRKYALIHAMAKERAKLYGNDYQINLLKKTLKGTFVEANEEDNLNLKRRNFTDNSNNNNNNIINPTLQQNNPSSLSTAEKVPIESCQKCKKSKRV